PELQAKYTQHTGGRDLIADLRQHYPIVDHLLAELLHQDEAWIQDNFYIEPGEDLYRMYEDVYTNAATHGSVAQSVITCLEYDYPQDEEETCPPGDEEEYADDADDEEDYDEEVAVRVPSNEEEEERKRREASFLEKYRDEKWFWTPADGQRYATPPGYGSTVQWVKKTEEHPEPYFPETSDEEFSDPDDLVVTTAPDKAARAQTKAQIAQFLRRWDERRQTGWVPLPEEHDRLFIKHACRHGMSAAAIAKTGIVTTGRTDSVGIRYRIQLLMGSEKDVTPKTADAAYKRHLRKQKIPTALDLERAALLKRIGEGGTAQQIVNENIVTLSKNTVRAIKHRWDTWIRKGVNLPVIR
ncbi:MAG: hypothetical protein Q9184_006374, partial [Pyrenodesmia sp. 2 TL-2023]